MKPVLTVAEMRAVDELAQARDGLEALIGRAGRALAGEAISMLSSRGVYGAHVALVAGPGNNGNDGRVAAGILARRGARIEFFDAKSPPAELIGADLVIDAAFGTGFRGTYRAPGHGRALVLAADVPTGLDADLGVAGAESVRADRTATFGSLKPGLLLNDGPDCCGHTVVHRIGLPVEDAGGLIHLVEDSDVGATLPPRRRSDHKWTAATVVVAGSPGMYGAALYASSGAARAGAGMVRLCVPGADPAFLPAGEAVSKAVPLGGFDLVVMEDALRFRSLVVGPGLGTAKETVEAVRRLVADVGLPTVVDADGLSALGNVEEAARVVGARGRGPSVVLTPHEGEFARLAGHGPGADRVAAVRDLAARTGAVVLLKGSTTVVADPVGRVLLAAAGTPSLATAGSGDVLSGVIGAFLARGVPALEAAAIAAHVHGRAAGLGRREGLVAGDLPVLVADFLSAVAGGCQGLVLGDGD